VDDLQGVLSYLLAYDPSNLSEGRNTAVEKSSFSQTELINCQLYPISRQVDYLVYRYRFNEYPRKRILHHFPLVLQIEPTSVCNLRCIMCFQVDPALSKDKRHMGFMDFGLYTKLIDEGAEHGLCAIVLASRGEPTLHPRFTDMIAYARNRGILDIKINTNATKLTKDYARRLLVANPNTIVFSVDSSNKEEFERIRVGAKFEQVVENIKAFKEIREKEFPHVRLRTRISMVVLDSQQDCDAARHLWASLVDEFAVGRAVDWVDIYHKPFVTETRSCSLLWERLYVWWDGTVNPCDVDYLSYLSFGKIDEHNTVQSVWLGEAMERMRALHLRGEKNCLHPCDRCPGF
jgi:uncharacterized Fe-S cluster-containing radical SAM superfamily protein